MFAWSMVQVQRGLGAWKVVQAIHGPFMECLKGVRNTVNQSNVHSVALLVEEGGHEANLQPGAEEHPADRPVRQQAPELGLQMGKTTCATVGECGGGNNDGCASCGGDGGQAAYASPGASPAALHGKNGKIHCSPQKRIQPHAAAKGGGGSGQAQKSTPPPPPTGGGQPVAKEKVVELVPGREGGRPEAATPPLDSKCNSHIVPAFGGPGRPLLKGGPTGLGGGGWVGGSVACGWVG